MVLPLNIRVMDVEKFIKENRISEVTSTAIKIATSSEFDPEGLFSETIFGEIGTLARATTHGYINLKAPIIAPVMYRVLSRLGDLYIGILSGKTYAVWDEKEKNFQKVFGDPEETPNSNTGYSFFMKYYPKIVFKRTSSLRRETKLDLLDKYRTVGLYTKYLVEPAAIRDVQTDETGRLVQDDINKLYVSLISYARALPDENYDIPIYDALRYNIQLKCQEIFEYIQAMMTGKKGFLQGSLSDRKITLGTRNVLTATSYVAKTPKDPHILKPDETMVGVFQTAKAFQPLVFYYLKTIFFNEVLGDETSSYNVALINAKTLESEYTELTEDERLKWVSSDGVNSLINKFRNLDIRHKPVTIKNNKGEPFYISLVLDLGDELHLSYQSYKQFEGIKGYSKEKVRPLTWIELMYIATYQAVKDKHVHVTRYPVIGDGSTYPTRVHLASTLPARSVIVYDYAGQVQDYPEYPILGNAYQDTVQVGFDRLEKLVADFDGDTVSINGVLSEEANEECRRYLNSTQGLVNTQSELIIGRLTSLATLALYNWTC